MARIALFRLVLIATLTACDAQSMQLASVGDANAPRDGRAVRATEAYGAARAQHRAYRVPAGAGPFPVVFLVHGGCWLAQYGTDLMDPLADALQERGYAVITPEYRRIGESGGGWPGTFDDVALALDSLPQSRIAAALDLSRVTLVGHSAGGHLALWLALRGDASGAAQSGAERTRTSEAVVGLAAITDLEQYARGGSGCQQATRLLLGGSPREVPERYAATSPVALAALATRPRPAVTLVVGTRDRVVGPGQADALAAVLPGTRIVRIPDAGHFDMIEPDGAAFEALLAALAAPPVARPAVREAE